MTCLKEVANVSFAYCNKNLIDYEGKSSTQRVAACKPSSIQMFQPIETFDIWLPDSEYYIERYSLELGDVVVKANGFNPVSVTERMAEKVILISSNAFIVRPNLDKIMAAYLWALLVEFARNNEYSYNAKVTRGYLESLEFNLPSKLEQQQWLSRYTELQKQERQLWNSLMPRSSF